MTTPRQLFWNLSILSVIATVLLTSALTAQTPPPRYWVDIVNGNDSNLCSAINSQTQPANMATGAKRTIGNTWTNCFGNGVEQRMTLMPGTYTTAWHNLATKNGLDATHRTIVEGFAGNGTDGCAIAGTCNTTIIATSGGTNVNDQSFLTIRYIKWSGANEPVWGAGGCIPSASCGTMIRFGGTSGNDNQLIDSEMTGSQGQGVFTNPGISAFRANRVYCHDTAIDIGQNQSPKTSADAHCYYIEGNNNVVENSLMERVGIFANGRWSNSYGVQCYSSAATRANNCIVRNNIIRDGANGVIVNGNNTLIYNNLIYGGGGRCFDTGYVGNGGSPTGIIISNNTCYNMAGYAIQSGNSSTSETVTSQNNIFLATNNGCTPSATCQYNAQGSSIITKVNDKNTGVITDCTVSSSVFTQNSTSTCINAGQQLAGHPFNDTNPDQGAFEKVTFASSSVENGDASTLRVTFNNSAFPPLSPASGITGFTSRKNGANNPITSAVINGTNQVYLGLTNAISAGDTVDVSYSGGNLKDSALIGYTISQPYVQTLTNQTVTNNVSSPGSEVYTQTVFKFFGLRGTQAAPVATPYAAAPENTNILIVPNGRVRLRVGVSCTIADCPPMGFIPRYSRNAGAYTVIPDTFGADAIGFCGTNPDPDIPLSGTSTTQQLSGSGTFAAGALIRTSNAIPTVNMTLSGRTELEYCLAFNSASAGDIFDIRLYQQNGSVLNAYTVTPRMTIRSAQTGVGF